MYWSCQSCDTRLRLHGNHEMGELPMPPEGGVELKCLVPYVTDRQDKVKKDNIKVVATG